MTPDQLQHMQAVLAETLNDLKAAQQAAQQAAASICALIPHGARVRVRMTYYHCVGTKSSDMFEGVYEGRSYPKSCLRVRSERASWWELPFSDMISIEVIA